MQNGAVSNLTYGIEPKWGQMTYISSANAARFREVVYGSEKENLSGCEMLNRCIEGGCNFTGTSPAAANFIEVDALRHITQFLRKETA